MADNSFSFDQPWNPISYFDEETEDKTGIASSNIYFISYSIFLLVIFLIQNAVE